MFEPSASPRVYACPPGEDFTRNLVLGLRERMAGHPPEAMAKVEIFVNTRRMQRRIIEIFNSEGATLLPRLRLVTDLLMVPDGADLPAPVGNLERRLDLSRLIRRLLDSQPDLAPRAAIFDLADSLADLMAEMQDEGVSPEVIRALDVTDSSGYWQRSLLFLNAIAPYFAEDGAEAPDVQGRNRRVVERLVAKWQATPPSHPVLVAGSTGSRGTTAKLMEAVARLPQGALVLPGFDFDLPEAVWSRLDDAMTAEDHPQYRFARLLSALEVSARDVRLWTDESKAPVPARNHLISLALRPAPVTDQWMIEGPALTDIAEATRNMTLIEAPSSRLEAVAIATVLRKAAADGRTAALITPDRTLTRMVTAALDRWGIEPDVSAGEPLKQTAVGRLLRHVADLFGEKLTIEKLLSLLKHPMVNSANEDRGQHTLWTLDLEIRLRRYGPPFPQRKDLLAWAVDRQNDDARVAWASWLSDLLDGLEHVGMRSADDHLAKHLDIATRLVAGPAAGDGSQLWATENGKVALRHLTEFQAVAHHAGALTPTEYRQLVVTVLDQGEVRDPVRPHPGIMIWGTLEARVQGADVVILGGLNEGVWPESPSPDPWLNRELRLKAGLLLPDRRIGLSAHDFQQAVAAPEVILTRAVRGDEAETVASRWLNRLSNLMRGISTDSAAAYDEMLERGQKWLRIVNVIETPTAPVPPETRPSPQPPVAARPRSLSVTAISRLIRDPYAIYARHVLRLRPLDPTHRQADAPLRGTILHHVMEEFVKTYDSSQSLEAARKSLLSITDHVLEAEAPWPAARVIWRAKLERVADRFLLDEVLRQERSLSVFLEESGGLYLKDLDFTLTAKADRIDRLRDGQVAIYDYKTGAPPSVKVMRHFDKQLMLEAMLVEAGAFEAIGPAVVAEVAHIGLGTNPVFDPHPLASGATTETRDEFVKLVAGYLERDQGYTSRRAMAELRHGGDFDHLARYGEWDETQEPTPMRVGK